MRKSLAFWITIALCLIALVASAVLLVDYVRPAPVFCGADGGCGAVKRSAYAFPLGIPMPVFGIAGFLAIAFAAMVPGRRARIGQAMVASFAGIVALGLFVVQATLNTICPYCAVVDGVALVLAGLSIARALKEWDPPKARPAVVGSAVALVIAVAAPVSFGMSTKIVPLDVPANIAEEIRKTPRGKVTVVDFVDFECPFCRMTHAEFEPVLAQRKDKVRVVRKHVPLRMHPHAMDMAKTACCGEAQGKGDEIAEALFKADPERLTPEGCEELAREHGLDAAQFKSCFSDPSIAARIRADSQAFRDARGHGLPTIYIDGTKLEGAQDRETLESTLDGAIKAL
ncbi:MAG: thioredoxin domain-containing protein [Labilithrix sp.]|nr:thioredoxin domain-containing protein [Labilithrix sp.]